MIFTELRTSSNYEVKNKKTGGKNGYGAKLTNYYSKFFSIITSYYNK
jgi:DNA topoisomerase-2